MISKCNPTRLDHQKQRNLFPAAVFGSLARAFLALPVRDPFLHARHGKIVFCERIHIRLHRPMERYRCFGRLLSRMHVDRNLRFGQIAIHSAILRARRRILAPTRALRNAKRGMIHHEHQPSRRNKNAPRLGKNSRYIFNILNGKNNDSRIE